MGYNRILYLMPKLSTVGYLEPFVFLCFCFLFFVFFFLMSLSLTEYFFTFGMTRCSQAHRVHASPHPWARPSHPRVLVPCSVVWCLETKVWVLKSACLPVGVSASRPSGRQSGDLCVWICTHPSILIHTHIGNHCHICLSVSVSALKIHVLQSLI